MTTPSLITNTVNTLYELYSTSREGSFGANPHVLLDLLETANALYDNNKALWNKIDATTLERLQDLNQVIPKLKHTFTKNTQTKQMIAGLGVYVCDALEKAVTDDDFAALNQIYNTFRALVQDYHEDTGDIAEDIGVSLGEALLMKRQSPTSDSEWRQYMTQDRRRL